VSSSQADIASPIPWRRSLRRSRERRLAAARSRRRRFRGRSVAILLCLAMTGGAGAALAAGGSSGSDLLRVGSSGSEGGDKDLKRLDRTFWEPRVDALYKAGVEYKKDDKGADSPVATEYTRNLRPLLNAYGNDLRFTLVLFTLDESTYARELAPLRRVAPHSLAVFGGQSGGPQAR